MPLRIGIVGCGQIAHAHAAAVMQCGEFLGVGAVDIDSRAARDVASLLGCPHFANPFDASLLRNLDAVVICTPPSTHFELVRGYLARGIAVLCEKPLTITSGDATALVQLASQRATILTMAAKFRHVPDVQRARALVKAGAVGQVLSFEVVFTCVLDVSDQWRSQRAIAGGGVIMDNGPHAIDLVRFLLGPVSGVHAMIGPAQPDMEVERSATVSLRTSDDACGHVELSWSYDRGVDFYAGIFGTSGAIQLGWRGSRCRLDGGAGWEGFGSGYSKSEAFERQMRAFGCAIRGEDSSVPSAEAALEAVRGVAGAYASAAEGRYVRL